MPVRKKLTHDQKTREKIRTSQLINRLESHVFGEVELTTSQVSAALGLIKKTLPDLSAVESKIEVTNNNASELTDAQLADIASAGSIRADTPASSKKVLN
jgi:hypothetical protein